MSKGLFRSAFEAGNWSPEDVLEFHRRRHGDFVMEGSDGGDDGSGGEGSNATFSGTISASNFTDPDTGDKYGFPPNTATSDMTPEQKAEYWRHKARKHESRASERKDYDEIKAELDQLKQANLTESEKAIQQARDEAAAQARKDVLNEILPQRVRDKVESAIIARGVEAKDAAARVDFIDYKKFLTDDEEIDTDKVVQYAESVVPASKDWPDMGQGRSGSGSAGPSVQSGQDRYAERKKKSA